MDIKKLLVTATLMIAASLLALSCQKEEPEQEQAAVKHSVEGGQHSTSRYRHSRHRTASPVRG